MRIQAVQGFFSKELLIIELNGNGKKDDEKETLLEIIDPCVSFLP